MTGPKLAGTVTTVTQQLDRLQKILQDEQVAVTLNKWPCMQHKARRK